MIFLHILLLFPFNWIASMLDKTSSGYICVKTLNSAKIVDNIGEEVFSFDNKCDNISCHLIEKKCVKGVCSVETIEDTGLKGHKSFKTHKAIKAKL